MILITLQVERHVAAVNALGADAIVLVGDLVDDQVAEIDSIVDPVSGFSAPDGKYFVQGEVEKMTKVLEGVVMCFRFMTGFPTDAVFPRDALLPQSH